MGAHSPKRIFPSWSFFSDRQDVPRTPENDWLPKAAFDVTMAKTFSDPKSPLYWDTIGGCCVTPPIGHHQPHISGTSGKMQGANKSWKASVHAGRWTEPWCRGGTRWREDHVEELKPQLMSMPRPGEKPVFDPSGILLFPEDHEELVWRTRLESGLEDIVFPGRRTGVPPAQHLKHKGTKIDRLAQYWLGVSTKKMMKGKNTSWHNTFSRQLNSLTRMVTKPVAPETRRHHTPETEGGFYDTDYQAPPGLSTLDLQEQRRSHMFRMYPLPFDPQAHLAYSISLAEGRLGKRACPHSDSWKCPDEVAAIVQQAKEFKKYLKDVDRKWAPLTGM